MTPRQWGLTGLLVAVPAVILTAALWQDRTAAAWAARARTAEAQVVELVQQATQARHDALTWRAVADSLRAHRDTLLVTRWRTILDTLYAGADSTLPACQAAFQGLRAACRVAVDSLGRELGAARTEADGYRAGLTAMTASDSLRGVALDSLRAVLAAVPTAKKWLGWISPPRVVVGVGCAGGTGFGCGLMAGVGFTFGGGR